MIERSITLSILKIENLLSELKSTQACRWASFAVWMLASGLTCTLLVGVVTVSWWTLLEYASCGLPLGLTLGSRTELSSDGLLLNPRFHASWLVTFEKKAMKTLNMAAVSALWIILSPLFLWVNRRDSGRPRGLKRSAHRLVASMKTVFNRRPSWFQLDLQQ
jgi:hypothetical protein